MAKSYVKVKHIEGVRKSVHKGWRKGSFGKWDDPKSEVCLLGAIYREEDINKMGHGESSLLREELIGAIKQQTHGRMFSIAFFNDSPETTKKDVLQVITATKRNLKKKGQLIDG